MEQKQKIILASPPAAAAKARATGLAVAHMAYRIGRDLHLYRSELSGFSRGGLMYVDSVDSHLGSIRELPKEIANECYYRNFSGIVLAFEKNCSRVLIELVKHLDAQQAEHGLKIYVPQWLGKYTKNSVVLISSHISTGSLEKLLDSACAEYSPNRVALEVECGAVDYSIPCLSEMGRPISAEECERLKTGRSSFFSRELCSYYFTYHKKNEAHFVLYDNAASIRRKLYVAEKMGIDSGFFYYPEVSEILDEIAF